MFQYKQWLFKVIKVLISDYLRVSQENPAGRNYRWLSMLCKNKLGNPIFLLHNYPFYFDGITLKQVW